VKTKPFRNIVKTQFVASLLLCPLALAAQTQVDCSFPHPPALGTFQAFDAGYSASTYITLTDARDSREYAVVKIGQYWIMAQNLNYQKDLTWQAYSNLPSTRYGAGIGDLIGHFWCPGGFGADVNSSVQASCDTWGALYAWETAMMVDGKWSDDKRNFRYWVEPAYSSDKSTGKMNNGGKGANGHGICPEGWHVPTDAEWGEVFNTLEDGAAGHNMGYSYNGKQAGARAKALCVCPSHRGNICVNDKMAAWFDLAAPAASPAPTLQLLPAGSRSFDGHAFEGRGLKATLWSSSAYSAATSWYRSVKHDAGYVYRYVVSRSTGASVRCIKN
jgi:uncharacterized protein (TIGR02145 family)